MSIETKGRPDKVYFNGKEYRSVYWCYALNEPFVMSFETKEGKRVKKCEFCGPDYYEGQHTYICTVGKP